MILSSKYERLANVNSLGESKAKIKFYGNLDKQMLSRRSVDRQAVFEFEVFWLLRLSDLVVPKFSKLTEPENPDQAFIDWWVSVFA